jgi:hypothetical protein
MHNSHILSRRGNEIFTVAPKRCRSSLWHLSPFWRLVLWFGSLVFGNFVHAYISLFAIVLLILVKSVKSRKQSSSVSGTSQQLLDKDLFSCDARAKIGHRPPRFEVSRSHAIRHTYLVGLDWKNNHPFAKVTTYTINKIEEYPHPQRNSNPQFLQASGCRIYALYVYTQHTHTHTSTNKSRCKLQQSINVYTSSTPALSITWQL